MDLVDEKFIQWYDFLWQNQMHFRLKVETISYTFYFALKVDFLGPFTEGKETKKNITSNQSDKSVEKHKISRKNNN